MKPGFGKAKGKKKTKQTKKKNKQAKNKPIKSDGGDDAMMDVADPAPAEQQQAAAAAPMEATARGAAGSAKDRQRQRMQLKQSLRVKVHGLKGNRQKLTKMPGNREQRRKLNTQIKELMAEQAGLTNATDAS